MSAVSLATMLTSDSESLTIESSFKDVILFVAVWFIDWRLSYLFFILWTFVVPSLMTLAGRVAYSLDTLTN